MNKYYLVIICILLTFITSCETEQNQTETDNPKITINLNPGVDTIQVNTNYIDPGATATYGDTPLDVSIKDSSVDTSTEGVYEIIYESTYDNMTIQISRNVYVINTGIQVKLNPGIDTIKINTVWNDAGIIATDMYGNNLVYETEGTVDISKSGKYEVLYRVEDDIGNVRTITRNVFVIDGQ